MKKALNEKRKDVRWEPSRSILIQTRHSIMCGAATDSRFPSKGIHTVQQTSSSSSFWSSLPQRHHLEQEKEKQRKVHFTPLHFGFGFTE